MRKSLVVLGLVALAACSDGTAPEDRLTSLAGRIVYTSDRDGELHVWTMLPDGTDNIRLTDDTMEVSSPGVSPDGRELLLSDGSRLLALDIATRRVRELARVANVTRADWSAVTSLIVVSYYDPAAEYEIALVDPKTGAVTPIASTPGDEHVAAWSPDGQWIAFSSDRDVPDGQQLYIIRRDGTGLRRLTHSPTDIDAHPDWAPDGTIAFRRLALGDFSQRVGFLTLAGDDTTFMPGMNDVQMVRFSPDGTQLLVGRQGPVTHDIWRVNRDGSGAVDLTDGPISNVNPDWLPD